MWSYSLKHFVHSLLFWAVHLWWKLWPHLYITTFCLSHLLINTMLQWSHARFLATHPTAFIKLLLELTYSHSIQQNGIGHDILIDQIRSIVQNILMISFSFNLFFKCWLEVLVKNKKQNRTISSIKSHDRGSETLNVKAISPTQSRTQEDFTIDDQ